MSIFSKSNIFLHFKTTNFFIPICSFETFLTRFRYLLFQVALCNQPTIVFAPLKAISTFKPYCAALWNIGFSTVTYIKLWWSVKDLQKNALKTYGTRSTVNILTSDKNLVFFFKKVIFSALINNPNNFEIW